MGGSGVAEGLVMLAGHRFERLGAVLYADGEQ